MDPRLQATGVALVLATAMPTVSEALVSEGVVDIFAAAGLQKPDISILSDEFLADVRGMPHRNLAVELLQKLLKGEVRSRRQHNVVQVRSFAELLEQSIRRYQNRAIEPPRSSKSSSASPKTCEPPTPKASNSACQTTATGHLQQRPVLSVLIPRRTLEQLNLLHLDPADALVNFVHKIDFKPIQGMREVDALESPERDRSIPVIRWSTQ